MRKGKWIAAGCCAVALLAGAGIIALGAMVDRVKQIPVCNPNLEEIADGACFGEYSAGPVAVKVQVAVEGHELAEIEVGEHKRGPGGKAEDVIVGVIAS